MAELLRVYCPICGEQAIEAALRVRVCPLLHRWAVPVCLPPTTDCRLLVPFAARRAVPPPLVR